MKHETGWGLIQYADGVLDWISPNARHFLTKPDVVMPAEPPPEEEWEEAPFDLP